MWPSLSILSFLNPEIYFTFSAPTQVAPSPSGFAMRRTLWSPTAPPRPRGRSRRPATGSAPESRTATPGEPTSRQSWTTTLGEEIWDVFVWGLITNDFHSLCWVPLSGWLITIITLIEEPFLSPPLLFTDCCLIPRENGLLKETKSELEHAIAETERPLRINNECIKNREARISIDLVKDEVENSLEREVENIKTYQQRMQKMLARVNQQIETNHSMQVRHCQTK